MKIVMTKIHWLCKRTNRLFKEYAAVADSSNPWYGTFFLYGRDRTIGHWDTLSNPVYKELNTILAAVLPTEIIKDYVRNPFFAVIGGCCDPAPDGSLYLAHPYCPFCHDDEVRHTVWEDLMNIGGQFPAGERPYELPDMTLEDWKNLELREQMKLVHEKYPPTNSPPPETKHFNLIAITNRRWVQLSDGEKRERVISEIKRRRPDLIGYLSIT